VANVISAVLTNSGRAALAQSFGGASGGFSWSSGKYFKIGTAMYTQGVSGQEAPLPPNASFTDIQSAASGVYWYRQSFVSSNILFISASTIQFQCFLDLTYGNGDVADTATSVDGPKNTSSLAGNPPVFYELGIFDAQGVMVAYGTFPGETKLNTKTLNHLVNINF
jgi:hypothetical protein